MISHTQKVLELINTKGLIRPLDLNTIKVPRMVLTRMVHNGQITKIGRGLYSAPDKPISEHASLAEVSRRTPQSVVCLLSALRFHELTTQAPFEVWIAIENKAHAPRVDYPPLRIMRFSGKALSEGVQEHQIDRVTVKVTNVAKTVADCFKYRNKIGLDVALEALHESFKEKRLQIDELWHYAGICRVTNVMRPYIESLMI